MSKQASTSQCPLAPVAASALGDIALCTECGAIHMTIQSLTVRLEPRAFLELAHMVVAARDALYGVDASSGAAVRISSKPDKEQELSVPKVRSSDRLH